MRNRWIKALIFILIAFLSLEVCSFVLTDKTSFYKNKDFFAENNQFDILFFGSSHMELFVSPLDLWSKYGIISYNFGAPEEGIPVTYQVIRNAIKKNKPKVIVLDVHMFNTQGNYSNNEHLHFGLDSFPLNLTKLESISESTNTKEDFLEMVFKIGKYHENWKNLTKSSFENNSFFMKGCMSYGYDHTMKVTPYIQKPLVKDETEISETSEDYVYIKKIIDLCNVNDIKLVFVSTPYICGENRQRELHYIGKIALDNNVEYINMIDMNTVIDMSIDMYDEGHVNQSGMQKVTDYIGNYLVSKYKLEDHRTDENYSEWNEDYKNYSILKYESMWYVDDLKATLMLLRDENIDVYIQINNDIIEEDDCIKRLLENITNLETQNDTMDQYIASVCDKTNDICIVVKERNSEEIKLVKTFNFNDEVFEGETVLVNFNPKYIFVE